VGADIFSPAGHLRMARAKVDFYAHPQLSLDLTKRSGGTLALDGLALAVRPGEVHGYLGPNGAGKPNLGSWQFFA
jgi:ABC-type uncharacterized transport system ATPase subunit